MYAVIFKSETYQDTWEEEKKAYLGKTQAFIGQVEKWKQGWLDYKQNKDWCET